MAFCCFNTNSLYGKPNIFLFLPIVYLYRRVTILYLLLFQEERNFEFVSGDDFRHFLSIHFTVETTAEQNIKKQACKGSARMFGREERRGTPIFFFF